MTFFAEIVASLLPDWPNMPSAERASVTRRCASLVGRQIELSPFYVRLGLYGLLAAFYCFVLLSEHLSASRHRQALEKFSRAPFPFCFALERVLRSTALLFYFEQPEVLTALGEQTLAERQALYRERRAAAELSDNVSQVEITEAPVHEHYRS